MANIKSQIKRDRQNKSTRERNRQVRTRLRTRTRRFHEAVDAGDVEAATDAYREAARDYDKAATKGVVHRNLAANRKSRMARRLQSM